MAEFRHYDAQAATADAVTAHLERLDAMAGRLHQAQLAWAASKSQIVPALRRRTEQEYHTHRRAIIHMQ